MSMLFLNSWMVSSHIVRYDTITLQLFINSNDTREKFRLNFHSLSVSVSELFEHGLCIPARASILYNSFASLNLTSDILSKTKSH